MDAQIQVFGTNVEATFGKSVAFTQTLLDQAADKLNQILGFRIPSEKFHLRLTDPLYNYELSSTFYGDNATFLLNANRISISLTQGRTLNDLEIMRAFVEKFYDVFLRGIEAEVAMMGYVHAAPEDPEGLPVFLRRFAPSSEVVLPAALGTVKVAKWQRPIRTSVEDSAAFPGALFVNWRTIADFSTIAEEDDLLEAMLASARIFGVELKLPL